MNSFEESSRKREQFHENIRRKAIENIQKVRREIVFKQIQDEQQAQKDIQLYDQIISGSAELINHGSKYLQMLREVLISQHVIRYKNQLSEVLMNMIRFYELGTGEAMILLMECLALIYY